MLRREIVGRVNKHINAMYPYTGEYIIDRMSMNGELTPNIDNVSYQVSDSLLSLIVFSLF